MNINKLADIRSALKNAYLKIALVILALAIIGLSTVSNYGYSLDESTQVANVKYNIDLVTKGKPIPKDLKYYGVIFDVTSEAVFQSKEILSKGSSYNPHDYQNLKDNPVRGIRVLYERIKVKHTLTFLLSIVAYISVAGIVGILAGLDYAWLAPVVLAFFPRFWGHSFFNPKDIPFAAMFTLGTFLGACLVGYYLKGEKEYQKFGINFITLYSILYGILIGLVTGTRIGGFFLLFFIMLAHLGAKLGRGNIFRDNFQFWRLYGLIFIAWIVTTTIIHPASWSNPVAWFLETLGYLSQHSWYDAILFEGQFIYPEARPWYYLPKWIIMTVPIIFQISFVIGMVWLLLKYPQLSEIQQACSVLVLLQIFFLPTMAIAKHSTMYDEMRQFLFILPAMAAISTTALVWTYQKISKKNLKIFAVAFIVTLFIKIALDMIALHPYEYVYFNSVEGGLAQARGRYETDYWGLSMREGMEWINKKANPNAKVLVGGYPEAAKIFAAPSLTIVSKTLTDTDSRISSKADIEQIKIEKPFYYIAYPRRDLQGAFPRCPVVHQVLRQNVPLTIVKKCD
jgi:hypothetical protein